MICHCTVEVRMKQSYASNLLCSLTGDVGKEVPSVLGLKREVRAKTRENLAYSTADEG